MDKNYTKKIDYKRLRVINETSLNLSANKGLHRIQNILKWGKILILSSIASYLMYTYIKHNFIRKYLIDEKQKINDFLEKNKNNKSLQLKIENLREKDLIKFTDMNKYYLIEAKKGVLELRYKLLNKAYGIVLETNCGFFENSLCYYNTNIVSENTKETNKIKEIIAVDSNKNFLELASLLNKKNNTKFLKMESDNLDFIDEAFDTVIDTFGLHKKIDPVSHYNEMKRVCKKNGKILLLEVGESLWITSIIRNIRQFNNVFNENGNILIRNWDDMILNDSEVVVKKRLRKNNGYLYYYELEKK